MNPLGQPLDGLAEAGATKVASVGRSAERLAEYRFERVEGKRSPRIGIGGVKARAPVDSVGIQRSTEIEKKGADPPLATGEAGCAP